MSRNAQKKQFEKNIRILASRGLRMPDDPWRIKKHSPQTGTRGPVGPAPVPSTHTDEPMATTDCGGVLPTIPTLAAAG